MVSYSWISVIALLGYLFLFLAFASAKKNKSNLFFPDASYDLDLLERRVIFDAHPILAVS